jgi:outer membrane protein assembly factor BamB
MTMQKVFDIAWRRNLHFRPSLSSIVFDPSAIFLVERRTRLVSIDQLTGETRWSASVDNPWGSLAVTPFVCVYIGQNGLLTCFDRRSGAVRWVSNVGGGSGHVAAASRSVITGGWRGYSPVRAFDLENGEAKWSWSNLNPTGNYVQPLAGDEVFVTSERGTNTLQKVDANTGDNVGTWSLPNAINSGDKSLAFTAAEDAVYFRTGSHGVCRLIDDTIENVWESETKLSSAVPLRYGSKLVLAGMFGGQIVDIRSKTVTAIGSSCPMVPGLFVSTHSAFLGLTTGHLVNVDFEGNEVAREHIAEHITTIGGGTTGLVYVVTKGELLAYLISDCQL